jgi:hypothetical protein
MAAGESNKWLTMWLALARWRSGFALVRMS